MLCTANPETSPNTSRKESLGINNIALVHSKSQINAHHMILVHPGHIIDPCCAVTVKLALSERCISSRSSIAML